MLVNPDPGRDWPRDRDRDFEDFRDRDSGSGLKNARDPGIPRSGSRSRATLKKNIRSLIIYYIYTYIYI
jgi:hypothetical protein